MKRWLVFTGILLGFCLLLSGEGLLFEKDEYARRRTAFMDKIPDGIAVVWGAGTRQGYYPFAQNNDFMYLCGVKVPNAVLIIDGIRRQSILFFTLTETGAKSENLSLELVENPTGFTGVERHYPRDAFSGQLQRLASRSSVLYTSFKPEELARECSNEKFNVIQREQILEEWDGRLTRELQFVNLFRERYPAVEVKDCSEMIWSLREIKSPAEIELIRKAGRIGVEAHTAMMKATRPGVYEYEIAALFEYICKKNNADLAYDIIISSAENHPYLHYAEHNRKLEKGDILVVDAGPDVAGYDVDISHTYTADGTFTPRQREVYEACLEVEKICLGLYKPGITCQEVREEVRRILETKGYDMEKDVFQKRSAQGGCSHYVGLAVHDVGGGPRGPLKPGMVFSCDIYAVFPDENLGVRVEDTVLITEGGCENLTAGIPREVEEIGKSMKKSGGRPDAVGN